MFTICVFDKTNMLYPTKSNCGVYFDYFHVGFSCYETEDLLVENQCISWRFEQEEN